MADLDPRTVTDLDDSFKVLNDTVRGIAPAFSEVLNQYVQNNKKLKTAFDNYIKAQEASATATDKGAKQEETYSEKQQRLFDKEVNRRKDRLDQIKESVDVINLLSDSQKQYLTQLDKKAEKDRKLAEYAKDPVNSFRSISTSANSLGDVFNIFQEKLFEFTGSSKLAAGGLMLGTAAVQGVTKAAFSMADSLYNGERGAKVGAKAFTELTSSITTAAYGISAALMFIPGVGIGMKLLGVAFAAATAGLEAYAKLQEKGAEYNDNLYTSFNKLSEAGLATSRGMTGIGQTMQKLSVSNDQMEKFNELLVSSSKDLALIGGIGSAGVEKFASVAENIVRPTGELNRKLLALGYTADEQREYTLKYLANEARLGFARGKSDSDLTKGATAYMEEMDKIAELTGISRKEQQSAREVIMKIDTLRAAMHRAKESGDVARQRELEAVIELTTVAQAEGRTEYATAFADAYAAGRGGVAVNPKAAAALQNERTRAYLEEVAQGKALDKTVLYGTSMEDIREISDKVASARKLGTDVTGMGMIGPFHLAADAIEKYTTAVAISGGDKEKLSAILQEEQDKRKNATDKLTEDNVKLRQTQQQTANNMTAVAAEFNGAAFAMSNAVKLFNDSVNAMSKSQPAPGAAGPAPRQVTVSQGGAAFVSQSSGIRGNQPSSTVAAPAAPAGNTASAAPTGPNPSSTSTTTPNQIAQAVPKASNGGIFTGPGSSSVFNSGDVLQSIKQSVSSVQKKGVESEMPKLSRLDASRSSMQAPMQTSGAFEILAKLTDTLESKFNDLIDYVDRNNSIKEDILDYSRI